ncbi:MAG: DUF3857 domain-containing protein, partial [Candidatus Omnitrophica bacterium]|nr:DUF3857 domain-containing protein [Candidatus Omnitrophota bacterium]
MPTIDIRKDKRLLLLFILVISACESKPSLDKARHWAHLSRAYYQKAIREYETLIGKGKADNRTYLELGKLYFEKGDYPLAIETLKRSTSLEAKKYLAFSYYESADYTEALKVFDALCVLEDDFYLYHYGLNCEALNLYAQAREIYNRIKNEPYRNLAQKNLKKIEQISHQDVHSEDKDLERFFDKKFSKEFYPDASILFLLVDEEFEIMTDNSAVYSAHFIIKILDEKGKENFSEVSINYDSTYEKPYLEFARTLQEDRTSVYAGKKHIRDVSRYLNFPLYSNARAMIISMPQVGVGCIIEYKFKIFKNQLIDKKHICLGYFVQENEPIVEANFSVILPAQRALNIKILNERYNQFRAELNPHIIKDKDKIRYTWNFKDIPQIIPEPYMPGEIDVSPVIMVSTINSWQEVYDWWWNLTKDKIKTSSAIKETVQKSTKEAKTPHEKAAALYNFCSRSIRYVAVAYGQAGYEPHHAEEIFFNKYGDCKDQSILLVTLLREAGLKAYPVLIGTKDHFDLQPDYPAVLFNHCIALVEVEGKNIFLDPTCTTCSFGDLPLEDQQRKVLVFKDTGFEIMETSLSGSEHNRLTHYFEAKLDPDGSLQAEKKIIPWGFYNQVQRAWLLYSEPPLIRQTIEEKLQDISVGAKLNAYRIENLEEWNQPVILKYNFQGPSYWINAGDL